jgi:hypothetical protein
LQVFRRTRNKYVCSWVLELLNLTASLADFNDSAGAGVAWLAVIVEAIEAFRVTNASGTVAVGATHALARFFL